MRDGKHVILCVDDDRDFLESVRAIVEPQGYIAETATSESEALEKYKAHKPDFVLVDLMMERIDEGVGLVREMQALGPLPPTYMISSVGDDLDQSADCSRLGLGGIFQKPVNAATLLSTLKVKLKKK